MRVYPVIMCGGAGTRLWPASRPSRPKQFLALLGGRSIFQETVLRLSNLENLATLVIVGNVDHANMIETQLMELGVSATLLLEPAGRDSTAAITAAALWIERQDPLGVAAIFASDHHIPDTASFQKAVNLAANSACNGGLITLGVQPKSPSQAYGYIKPGVADGHLFRVRHFVEKPDAATAKLYLEQGYLWNSGNLIAQVGALIDQVNHYAADVAIAVGKGLPRTASDTGPVILGPEFLDAPKISMDYAVLNKTDCAMVLPVAFDWSDLGAWDAVWTASDKDDDGNASRGEALFLEATNCLVRSDQTLVSLVGVSNLAVIVEPDAVLICDLGASQAVKSVVSRLQLEHRRQIDSAPSLALPTSQELATSLRNWFDHSALPVWWALGADHVYGGFHDALSANASPLMQPKRTRVQARQAYVFATAGLRGWAGPWQAAADHAMSFILSHLERPDGLFRTKVAVDGTIVDDSAWIYDQAFVLLALAACAKAMPGRRDLVLKAANVKSALQTRRWPGGGFREAGPDAFQSNCHMHLLEAALAMAEVAHGDNWRELADEIVELALARFIDPQSGRLVEFFDEHWNALRDGGTAIVDPGHQFEWAWLLNQWNAGRSDPRIAPVIAQLLASGRAGISDQGVLVNQIGDEGQLIDGRARLWPQTERLRAAYLTPSNEIERRACYKALLKYLATPIPGLWIDQLDERGQAMAGPAPASSLYHILGAAYASNGDQATFAGDG